MPPTVAAAYVLILVFFAALCSGLNIAVMSLNLAELKRKASLGDKRAVRVLPFRRNPHLTLAAILLTNVAFASSAAIVLGDAFNSFVAAIIATLLLVIFAELLPQAIFTKKALTFCSLLTPFLRLITILTYPLAKPLQLVLDRMFGDGSAEAARLHSRRELGLMINEHLGDEASELDEDEVEIIRGALQLSEKQVSSIMTEIRHVFWLTPDALIDSKTIDKIKSASWSRIPVFDKKLKKCYGILLMKDLVDIDFNSKGRKISGLPLHKAKIVGSKTALDTMFRHFIGARSHLIPIEQSGKIIGIITIEDLIEEIIGHEIIDESDRSANRV
jgi:metal transporter CNNM